MTTQNSPTPQTRTFAAWGGALAAAALLASPALAQRDPGYAAARAAGQIGEKPDGYLGVVGSDVAAQRLADDINIRRKAAYTREAGVSGATIEQFAFTTGCRLIANTAPGERYQAPDGSWQTRGAAPPVRDSRCP